MATKTTRTTKTNTAYAGERATEPKVKPERAKRNAERATLIASKTATAVNKALARLGFKSADEAYDAYVDGAIRVVGSTRANIYCGIMGIPASANSKFTTSKDASAAAARSGINALINLCGKLTDAERLAMAEDSLTWPALSHSGAASLVRAGDASLKAIRAIIAERQERKENEKAAKKAEKEAAKAGGKAAPRAAATVPVPAGAMTPKAEVSAMAIALMTKLNAVKYAKPVSAEELRLLKNVLDGFIERIA